MHKKVSKKKRGLWLALFSFFFMIPFFIPQLFAILEGSSGVILSRALAISGITLSTIAMLVAWLSYPRVHNFRITWLGVLFPMVSVAWFLFYLIPVSSDFSIPLYTWIALIEVHLLLFLILPESAKRKTTFWFVLIFTLFQSAFLYMLYYFSDIIPTFSGWGWLNECRVLIIVSASIFILITVVSLVGKRSDFYIGGMLSALQLFIVLFLMKIELPEFFIFKAFDYDHGMSLFFFFLSIILVIGILLHWFARIEHKVNYDPLLKIYNRQYCFQILEEKSSVKTAAPCSLVMLDIDHFKKVNDKYGHKAGDDVLFAVAQKVQEIVIPTGVLCRYGGEELVAIIPGSKRREAAVLMEKVRQAVESLVVKSGRFKIRVTLSFGISDRLDSADSLTKVLEIADKALYVAKDSGRNCIKSAGMSKRKVKAPGKKLGGSSSSLGKGGLLHRAMNK